MPLVVVVMGVSGSGKSTVGARLAARLGVAFADGDDFHTAEHVAKMRAGIALDEHDRAPWLALVAAWVDARLAAGEGGVVACSALRRSYRAAIVRGRSAVRIAYLRGSRDLIARRLAARRGHFMPATLLDSQFATLEPPDPAENAVTVSIADDPDSTAAAIAAGLGFSPI